MTEIRVHRGGLETSLEARSRPGSGSLISACGSYLSNRNRLLNYKFTGRSRRSVRLVVGLKPEKLAPAPGSLVFKAPSGGAIKSVGTWWNAAVLQVWKPSRPSEKRPRFHDLRKTAGTRIEAVSSHAVAKRLLGHADEDVTDSYLMPTLEDVRAAVDRAARLIDGEQVGNVVQFASDGTMNGTVTREAV